MKFISLSKRYVGSWAIVLLRENGSPSRFFTHLHVSMRALFFSSFLFVPTHFQFSPLQVGWHQRSSRLSLNTICHFHTTWGLVTHHAYQDHTISGTGVRNSLAMYFWLTSLPCYSAYSVFGQCSATTSITFICLQLAGRLQAYPGSPV